MFRLRQLMASHAWIPPLLIGALAGLVALIAILILRQPHDVVVLEFDGESRSDLQPIWIEGAVEEPGVYLLASEATVGEAIETAGGVQQHGDLTNLDTDSEVADRTFISVPSASRGATNRHGSISLNTAQAAELVELPGIGPVLAERIIEYRSENGPFATPEDLAGVSGISLRMVEDFRDQISLDE